MKSTMRKITIHQPDFLPWVGFFERWERSDFYVVLDDVQFLRRGWHHRDQIRVGDKTKWITIPVKKKGRYDQEIKDVLIDNDSNWKIKHLNLIKSSYNKFPFFEEVYSDFKELYSREYLNLADLNITILKYIAEKLKITTPMIFSSDLQIKASGTKRLIEIAETLNADIYLTGMGSKDYLEENFFDEKNIKVEWHGFNSSKYLELYKDFQPGLSIIDLLMSVPCVEISNVIKGEES